jgi:hypothetical protein
VQPPYLRVVMELCQEGSLYERIEWIQSKREAWAESLQLPRIMCDVRYLLYGACVPGSKQVQKNVIWTGENFKILEQYCPADIWRLLCGGARPISSTTPASRSSAAVVHSQSTKAGMQSHGHASGIVSNGGLVYPDAADRSASYGSGTSKVVVASVEVAKRLGVKLDFFSALWDIAREEPYPDIAWRDKLRMALDTAKALEFLHAQNPPIAHRDIKSQNILVKTVDRAPRRAVNINFSATAAPHSTTSAQSAAASQSSSRSHVGHGHGHVSTASSSTASKGKRSVAKLIDFGEAIQVEPGTLVEGYFGTPGVSQYCNSLIDWPFRPH